MSEKCSIPSCERASYALCHGCNSSFCREHMFEHSLSIHLELNPLIDEVNELNSDLRGLDIKELYNISYQQLEDWRKKSHQTIDIYFAEKTQDLDIFINEKLKQCEDELRDVQSKLITCMHEQETTHEQINLLTFQVQTLQRNFNKLKNNDFQIHIKPLTFDEKLINFDQYFNVSSLPVVYRVIGRSDDSYTSLATDNRHLLLHYEGTLLIVDGELITFRQTPWTYGPIYDMCYSSTLKRFIIINENEVFLFSSDTMTINKVRSIPWQQWFSCTSSDTSLYLSTKVYNSSLVQFNLLPSITFAKRWGSPDICTKDEAIDGVVYNNNKIALIISNDTKKIIRFELRSGITLARIWSLPLDIIYNENQAFRFCSINNNEWLIADHSKSRLLHITNEGMIKAEGAYGPAPCCVMEFAHNMLAISTKSVVHLHKL